MDQRFNVFSLERYRLELQQGAQTSYKDKFSSKEAPRPSKLRRLMSRIVTLITASSKVLKAKDDILMKPKGITKQSYMD